MSSLCHNFASDAPTLSPTHLSKPIFKCGLLFRDTQVARISSKESRSGRSPPGAEDKHDSENDEGDLGRDAAEPDRTGNGIVTLRIRVRESSEVLIVHSFRDGENFGEKSGQRG